MESIVLDDGIEYVIVKEMEIDGIKYTLFSNINDEKDICFRKTITENGKDYYAGLDSEKEFDKIILKFCRELK